MLKLLLGLLPGTAWLSIGGIALALAGAGVQTWRLHSAQTSEARALSTLATERKGWADRVAEHQQALATEATKVAALQAQLALRQQENERAQLDQIERARADGLRAGGADARLWERYASVVAARCGAPARDPAAVADGSAAEAARVLADVPRRIGEIARRYADIAESAIVRGERCERDWPVTPAS